MGSSRDGHPAVGGKERGPLCSRGHLPQRRRSRGFSTPSPALCRDHVIRNPVPRPEPDLGRGALDRFGLSVGQYVLATSRVTPEKGLETLLAAFNDSGLGGRGWHLLMAGNIRPSTAYRRWIAASAGATPATILAGELDAATLAQLYAVVASHHQGMSFSLLEAMSHGLRCIVSDIPANRATCGDHATYYPAGDQRALAAALHNAPFVDCRRAHGAARDDGAASRSRTRRDGDRGRPRSQPAARARATAGTESKRPTSSSARKM